MIEPGEKDQRRRLSVDEFEREYLGIHAAYPKWRALKASIRPGDEIWEFCSDKQSWDELMGFGGVDLVRADGEVETLIVRMN